MATELWTPEIARRAGAEAGIDRLIVPGRKIMRCAGCGVDFPYETAKEKRKMMNHAARCDEDSIQARAFDRENDGFRSRMDPERHDYLRAKQRRGEKVNWYREGLVH